MAASMFDSNPCLNSGDIHTKLPQLFSTHQDIFSFRLSFAVIDFDNTDTAWRKYDQSKVNCFSYIIVFCGVLLYMG